MPATSAMRHELRQRIRASNANTTAIPNSARMMYHGVYERFRGCIITNESGGPFLRKTEY
jgi:hypothetical protein